MSSLIGIVGSGLAAISAAKALVRRGVKPVILDCGEELDDGRKRLIAKLSSSLPEQWSATDVRKLYAHPLFHRGSIPKKLSFGSSYYYGKSDPTAPLRTDGKLPPFSFARGGLSVGWGAVVLPADDPDLVSWPIKTRELKPYYERVLADLPYSAAPDHLCDTFPLHSDRVVPISLTRGNADLLKKLESSRVLASNPDVQFGRSRLLVRARDDPKGPGCKYCGYCASGCVYDCIYRPDSDLDRLIAAGSLEYVGGVFVHELVESEGEVEVRFSGEGNHSSSMRFHRLFLAAGAVNSTRIVMNSKQLYGREARLLCTTNFVVPMVRFRRNELDWPCVNTQPGIILEFKAREFSNHWIHMQISTPNEVLLDWLGISAEKSGWRQRIMRRVSEHLFVAYGNIHSEHSNGYLLSLERPSETGRNLLVTRREDGARAQEAVRKATWALFRLMRSVGCLVVVPQVRSTVDGDGYHAGGTLPMKEIAVTELECDVLGRPRGWQRIHVVDTSVFPSLPATTIGLLVMANAQRIADQVEL